MKIELNLKRSEDNFSKTFNAAPYTITLSTFKVCKIFEVNEGFEQIFEYNKAEVIANLTNDLGLWKITEKRLVSKSIVESRGRIRNHEGKFTTKSGIVRILRFSPPHKLIRTYYANKSIFNQIYKFQ